MQEQPTTSPRRRPWIMALAVMIILSAAVFSYFSLSAKQPAPDVSLINLKGEKISTHGMRGKVVMINFWATDCATCIKEMPEMVHTYNKYKDKGLEFVAVAMRYDAPAYVINYAQTRKLPFHVAIDGQGDAAKAFGNVSLTPTTFVIDKQGNIIKRYVGEPEFPALHRVLEKALAG